MRRILAILLVIAFGLPLAAPLFASSLDTQANLPACCRRNGSHHCAALAASSSSTSPALNAPRCPVFPAAATPRRLLSAALSTPPAHSTLLVTDAARHHRETRIAQHRPNPAHRKRGPPALVA